MAAMKLSMVNFVCLTSTLFLHSVSTLSFRADEPRDVGGKPPKNAVVLFDGTNLDSWSHNDGRTASWILSDGAMVVKPNSGNLYTKQKFDPNDMFAFILFIVYKLEEEKKYESINNIDNVFNCNKC